jgi:transposase
LGQTWLRTQKLDHCEQRIAFEELMLAVQQARERVERLEQAIRDSVPEWSLAPVVEALQALRGMDQIAAAVFMSEIGDLSRFQSPRQLMAFLGLVPSERSTGESIIRGSITKTGNHRARRILIEAAWQYRHPPRVGKKKQRKVEAAPRTVREIAWKAQTRLCARYRKLTRRGKPSTTASTAVARELSAFIWAINHELATTEQRSQPRPHQACRRARVSKGQAPAGGRQTGGQPWLIPARVGLENERAETKKRAVRPNQETLAHKYLDDDSSIPIF